MHGLWTGPVCGRLCARSRAIPSADGFSVTHEPRPGELIDGYRIDAPIGRGGMGVVFLAEHVDLGRKVAFKMLSVERAQEPSFRKRFAREARLAARLDHPNVVTVYDAGESEDRPWIAMEYVDGADLRTRIGEHGGPLPPAEAVAVVQQVAAGLDHAHEIGVLHRDVKPANVLLAERSGRMVALLGDFGLTKEIDASNDLTVSGMVVGSIDYLAPEAIEQQDTDARADVYALAATLLTALTGAPPFTGTTATRLAAHVRAPRPRPSLRVDGLSPFDAVIARGLAVDPKDRYPTAGDFANAAAAALRRVESVRPIAGVSLGAQLGGDDDATIADGPKEESLVDVVLRSRTVPGAGPASAPGPPAVDDVDPPAQDAPPPVGGALRPAGAGVAAAGGATAGRGGAATEGTTSSDGGAADHAAAAAGGVAASDPSSGAAADPGPDGPAGDGGLQKGPADDRPRGPRKPVPAMPGSPAALRRAAAAAAAADQAAVPPEDQGLAERSRAPVPAPREPLRPAPVVPPPVVRPKAGERRGPSEAILARRRDEIRRAERRVRRRLLLGVVLVLLVCGAVAYVVVDTTKDDGRETFPPGAVARSFTAPKGRWTGTLPQAEAGWGTPRPSKVDDPTLFRTLQQGPGGRAIVVDYTTDGKVLIPKTGRHQIALENGNTGWRYDASRGPSALGCTTEGRTCVTVRQNAGAKGPGWSVFAAAPTSDEAQATAERVAGSLKRGR
jgi:tRNA A-37 threonylcarbamoyl transferase component Bud32